MISGVLVRDKLFHGYTIKKSLIVLACVALCCSTFWLWGVFQAKAASYDLNKTIRYSFLVKNDTSDFIDIAELVVFAPVSKNSYQKTLRVNASQKFEIIQDELGNQSLMFEVTDFPPYSSRVISITVELLLANEAQPFFARGDYVSSEPNIEVGAPEIADLVNELSGNGIAPENISSWIYGNVTDVGYISEDRGALYAITEKKGDCTEFASSFVAMMRTGGLPARMIGGFVIDGSGKIKAESYHNWAEFVFDDAWMIADPQKNIVDSGYGSYIAFYNFNKHSRMRNSHRFLSYDQRLSVQML